MRHNPTSSFALLRVHAPAKARRRATLRSILRASPCAALCATFLLAPAARASESGPILYLGSGFAVAGEQNTKINDPTRPAPPPTNLALGGPDFDFQYQDAALAELGLGYRILRHLRVEANVNYRGHTLQNVKYRPARGDVHWIAGMANVYADFPLGGSQGSHAAESENVEESGDPAGDAGSARPARTELPFAVPYVGVGVGVLWSKPRLEVQFPDRKIRGESAEFAWNVMLGTAIPLSRWVSLDLGYRYLESLDHRWLVRNGANGVGDADAAYRSHEGRVGLRIGY